MAKAAEEANESKTETRTEAAKGDVQAQMRLNRTNASAPAAKPAAPVAPDGTGELLNVHG